MDIMDLVVSKFGGTSLASSENFLKVKDIIQSQTNRRYIVASAPGKVKKEDTKITDLLYLCYDLANHKIAYMDILEKIYDKYNEIVKGAKVDIDLKKYIDELDYALKSEKSKDFVASRGEYINAIILSKLLGYEFVDAKEIIFFDENGNLDEEKSYKKIYEMSKEIERAVIPGFYGIKPNGEIKTFSRGGGDLTGSIVARGVETSLYENWTDVSGFLSADPRIVDNPKQIEMVTYKELRELSYAGASVLHEESILPLTSHGIPIEIKNTFRPEDKGTRIVSDEEFENLNRTNKTITGVAGKKHFSVINIEKTRLNSDKSFHRKLMSVLEVNGVSLEHMPSSIDSVSLIVKDKDISADIDTVISEIKTFCSPDKISVKHSIALITVVGICMKSHIGISAKLFKALADSNINIQMIIQGSSEVNIIIGIDEKDYENAIRSIYKAFIN